MLIHLSRLKLQIISRAVKEHQHNQLGYKIIAGESWPKPLRSAISWHYFKYYHYYHYYYYYYRDNDLWSRALALLSGLTKVYQRGEYMYM